MLVAATPDADVLRTVSQAVQAYVNNERINALGGDPEAFTRAIAQAVPQVDAFGALQPWEMPLSVAIAVLTIPGLVWLAARVYQRGVLHTGSRMKLTEALRS